MLLHATSVARAGRVILMRGPSGSGKSDLALRLIDRGWHLIADDRTIVTASSQGLMAEPPDTISGLLEVRGVGIVSLSTSRLSPGGRVIGLLDLQTGDVPMERMPEAASVELEGVDVPVMNLKAFEASAALKVEVWLDQLTGAGKSMGS